MADTQDEGMTITFNKDGTIEVEAQGFKGGACMDRLQFLYKALGAHETELKMKGDDGEDKFRKRQLESGLAL